MQNTIFNAAISAMLFSAAVEDYDNANDYENWNTPTPSCTQSCYGHSLCWLISLTWLTLLFTTCFCLRNVKIMIALFMMFACIYVFSQSLLCLRSNWIIVLEMVYCLFIVAVWTELSGPLCTSTDWSRQLYIYFILCIYICYIHMLCIYPLYYNSCFK